MLEESASKNAMLQDFMSKLGSDVIGGGMQQADNGVDNMQPVEVNEAMREALAGSPCGRPPCGRLARITKDIGRMAASHSKAHP